MTKRLEGKVAIVTGAARGIGRAYCLAMAREGANIVAVDLLDTSPTKSSVEQFGVKALALKTDVSVEDDTLRMAQVKKQKSGRIINIASSTVFMSFTNLTHYIAAKAGVIGMTRALATELGDFGILVNAISPGLTQRERTVSVPDEIWAMQVAMQSVKRREVPEVDWYFRRVEQLTVPRIQALLETARRAALQVIYTRVASVTRDGREMGWRYKSWDMTDHVDSHEAQILEELALSRRFSRHKDLHHVSSWAATSTGICVTWELNT